ncbi:MAG: flagellar assembly factor FliW [Micromonosporaceae bacterium]
MSVAGPPGDVPLIEFVLPMPGFPDHRRFLLLRLEDDGLIYALTSVEDPSLRFIVVPPPPFFPDYAPEIDDETLALLDVHDADRLLVLLVVTTGATADDATANLLAPIVVDQATRRAVQAVLAGSGLPVSRKLLAVA